VNADIAAAFEDYRLVTGDDALERECGLEVLVETARLWRSLGARDRDGGWHIDGVTGPDEYTAVVNDNVFTNLMAARNLRTAADACARHQGLAAGFGVTPDEIAGWRDAARAIHVPYDQELGVHPQCESFTRLGEWEFDEKEQYPLMLHAPYVQLYPRQVVKQADLVLAMHWCGEYFTIEQMARNLDYYERRTVRDSSLSACTQSVMCAEVGHLELAHEYLREAALMDLRDLHGNTGSGLHLACLAGAWTALVEGFGGLGKRGDSGGEPALCLAPVLPDAITRLAFRVTWRGTHLCVEVTHGEVRCSLPRQSGARLSLRLYEETIEVRADTPITRPVRRQKATSPPPEQPPGRGPLSRG
jgi:trehalose/maltose hydrolase-like predicted phosphorylase